jgi:hypothetical protein
MDAVLAINQSAEVANNLLAYGYLALNRTFDWCA